MITLRVYETAEGTRPFDEWFDSLVAKAAVKVTAALTRMEKGNFGDVKPVGHGVSERRIDFGPDYRVYFGRDGDEIVILLCGGTKKRQQKDIEAAKAYWKEYKRRKKGG
ncbi:MAG: type II toxin-antitoxin system RelE/ParE family toxin [Pseudomonadota bacterium]